MNRALLLGGIAALLITSSFTVFAQESATTTAESELIVEDSSVGTSTDVDLVPDEPLEAQAESLEEVVASSTEPSQTNQTPTEEFVPLRTLPFVQPQAMIDAAALQDAYFAKYQKYLQVIRGNALPEYESGAVLDKLGATVDSNVLVHVYESPKGMGYQVIYDDGQNIYSVGYGPEAEDRTYVRDIPVLVATSTEQVIDSGDSASSSEATVLPIESGSTTSETDQAQP